MEGSEDPRQKRLAELQQMQALEAQKRYLLKNLVEPAAYERLMNVRLANPELYDQMIGVLAQLYKAGRVRGKVSEAQVLQLLGKLKGGERETTISIRRKQ